MRTTVQILTTHTVTIPETVMTRVWIAGKEHVATLPAHTLAHVAGETLQFATRKRAQEFVARFGTFNAAILP